MSSSRWNPIAALAVLALVGSMSGALRVATPTSAKVRCPPFGALRTVLADLAWLRVSEACERADLSATLRGIDQAVGWDPGSIGFWIQGARIVAYDVAAWRVAALPPSAPIPAELKRRVAEEQGREAIRRLERALQLGPRRAALWLERANIEFNCLRDPRAAAESYRRAAEAPDAPAFAGRLHAEMLRRAGDERAALDYLVRLLAGTPPDSEPAATALIRERIHELERSLGGEGGTKARGFDTPAR